MVRFGLSLVAASLIAFCGYSALGAAAHASDSGMKVIAVVTAHAHRSSVSTLRSQAATPILQ